MKKILIYGRGKVGQSLAHFCDAMEYSYEIVDDADNIDDFSAFDTIIPSPGIPSSHKVYES